MSHTTAARSDLNRRIEDAECRVVATEVRSDLHRMLEGNK